MEFVEASFGNYGDKSDPSSSEEEDDCDDDADNGDSPRRLRERQRRMPSMAEVAKEFELDRDLEQKATYEISCATFLLDVRKDGVDSSRCLPAAKSVLGVNCNIAATGHKLQGTSKDSLIIGSWNYTFI